MNHEEKIAWTKDNSNTFKYLCVCPYLIFITGEFITQAKKRVELTFLEIISLLSSQLPYQG